MLASPSLCKTKSHDVAISLTPVEGCRAVFYFQQYPNPFLKNARQVRVGNSVEFRVGDTSLKSFPEEISLRVYYRRTWSDFITVKSDSCDPFDANTLRFIAVWSNKSRTLTAGGQTTSVQRHDPEPFCEDKCSDWWTYDLTIESKDVPLTDDLIVMITTADGTRVAKLFGGLGPLDYNVNPSPAP
jgi:hypothetical protein